MPPDELGDQAPTGASSSDAHGAAVVFDAKYFDGKTSRPHAVRVTAREDAILVESIPVDSAAAEHQSGTSVAPISVTWPLAQTRIAPRIGDTPRSITFEDGSKCETDNNDQVDRLARTTGQAQGLAFVHWLESRWKVAVASVAIVGVVIALGFTFGIPFAAKHVAKAVPDELAYELGQDTLDALDRLIFDPSELSTEAQLRLRDEFAELAAHHGDLPLRLEFRRAEMPNAFALPDGTIVITDQLVELAEHDEELLAVLAHEIGHVSERHAMRVALESSSIALLLSAYLGDVTQVALVASSLPTIYAQSHYSRSHETEADTFALESLKRSGIDPHRFSTILKKLQNASGAETDGAMQYISSHPPTAERIRRFEGAE